MVALSPLIRNSIWPVLYSKVLVHAFMIKKVPLFCLDKRKFVDAEKFKIEFKKDVALKNKQSIAELYEEEIPMRKSKKEKREASAAHSKSKKSYDDDVMIEKEGSVRNVQLKGNSILVA